jgi:hypothetical protein
VGKTDGVGGIDDDIEREPILRVLIDTFEGEVLK